VLLETEKIKAQVAEVIKKLEITPDKKMLFTRCLLCNAELVAVEKEKIKDKVPEYVFKTQDNFITCPKCNRIYWQGTHWGNVEKTLEEILK